VGKHEGHENYLWMGSVEAGVAGGGPATAVGQRYGWGISSNRLQARKAATWLQLAVHYSLLVVAIFISKAASLRLRCSNAGASRAAAAAWPLEK
jgi:hypothetical protein